jgi:ABC-2 type transport system permease protein
VISQIITLVKKDLLLFRRDRFYFLITVVGLVLYFVIYLVMPKTVNETLKLGVYAPGITEITNPVATQALGKGVDLKIFDNVADLRETVLKNEYLSGVVLQENFLSELKAGGKPVVTLFFAASAPEELKLAVTAMINEIASQVSGQEILLNVQTEVLGQDFSGNQIPWRDRLIPMMVIMILATEVLSLANLISTELQQNTMRALLVTPLRLGQLLTAKAVLGIGMACIQVLLFVAVVGGLSHQPLAMILVLIVGSILVTGIGFLVASLARDMMGVTAWGMAVVIILIIPALGSMIPGILSDWSKVIPSYHLTDAITQLVNYGAGLNDISGHILITLGWTATFAVTGVLMLRRRYA